MAKGPIVTPEIEALIASVYEKHPGWKAPRVRMEVVFILSNRGRRFPEGWPSLSKVQKVLALVRKNLKNSSPEDEPWSLGALNRHDVSSEVLPALLELKENLAAQGQSLTVREARWASRLVALIHTRVISRTEAVGQWSYKYAVLERVHELAEVDLDTSDLDRIIKDYAEPWAAYPSLWDTLERQEGFALTASLLRYLMELRYTAKERNLTKYENDLLSLAQHSETWLASQLALIHTPQSLNRLKQSTKALEMVFRVIDAGESVTRKSAERVLGKKEATWLISHLAKGANRAPEGSKKGATK